VLSAEIQTYFSAQHPVVFQLFQGWKLLLTRLFSKVSVNCRDQDYYGEVFDDLDELFKKCIEKESGSGDVGSGDPTMKQQALEQQQQHQSEHSVIDDSHPIRRESRRKRGLSPEANALSRRR